MNQEAAIFNYAGVPVRTVVRDGVRWFVARDLAEILGIRSATIAMTSIRNCGVTALLTYSKDLPFYVANPGARIIPESEIPKLTKHRRLCTELSKVMEWASNLPRPIHKVIPPEANTCLPEASPNIFIYSGYDVRTVIIDGEPWFVAADICEILDIKNPTDALKTLDNDERARFNLGRQGVANIISESGLHSLAMASRKAEAKAFKKWVTGTVLPEIRKTGSFNVTEHKLPGSFAEALRMLATQVEQTDQLRLENNAKQLQLEEAKPKVDLHDSIMELEGLSQVDEVAKLLEFKVQSFRDYCRQEKRFILLNGIPSAGMLDKGYMKVKTTKGNNGIQDFVNNVPYFTLAGISAMKRICNRSIEIMQLGGTYTCLKRCAA